MKQLFKFNDLGYSAQKKAIENYRCLAMLLEGRYGIKFEADELSTCSIADTLKHREDLYSEDGKLMQAETNKE